MPTVQREALRPQRTRKKKAAPTLAERLQPPDGSLVVKRAERKGPEKKRVTMELTETFYDDLRSLFDEQGRTLREGIRWMFTICKLVWDAHQLGYRVVVQDQKGRTIERIPVA